MSRTPASRSFVSEGPIELIPRMKGQGYEPRHVEERRRWVEQKLGVELRHVGSHSIPAEEMRGNVENPIGAAQMPLGVAGPLLVNGLHAQGTFYVPLATTEGALVRSYERGMLALTRAGGVTARVLVDENVVSPVFFFDSVDVAYEFATTIGEHFETLRAEAESTTTHGKLRRVDTQVVGREVIVNFHFYTADAQGMNMIVKAADRAAQWIMANSRAYRFHIFSGLCSEKRPSGFVMGGGKGKKAVAGARLPAEIIKAYLRTTAADLFMVWQHSVIGHLQANAIGFNAHYANGLTALFVATGQDVANVANASVGITEYELMPDGDLYASVTLPSLTVATVGGGTGLGTSRECLQMLGCAGPGGALKFAEIVAATMLAGELSMAGAIGAGEFVTAHETYGRNRPKA